MSTITDINPPLGKRQRNEENASSVKRQRLEKKEEDEKEIHTQLVVSPTTVSEAVDFEALGTDTSKHNFIDWTLIKPHQMAQWLEMGPIQKRESSIYNEKLKKHEPKTYYYIPVGRHPRSISDFDIETDKDKIFPLKFYVQDQKFAFAFIPFGESHHSKGDTKGQTAKGTTSEKKSGNKKNTTPSMSAQITFYANNQKCQDFKLWLEAKDAFYRHAYEHDPRYMALRRKDYTFKKNVRQGNNKKGPDDKEIEDEFYDPFYRVGIRYDKPHKTWDLALFLDGTYIPEEKDIKDPKTQMDKKIPNPEHKNFWNNLRDIDFLRMSNYGCGYEESRLNGDKNKNIYSDTRLLSFNLFGSLPPPLDHTHRALPGCTVPVLPSFEANFSSQTDEDEPLTNKE